jgi:hypothetical protein
VFNRTTGTFYAQVQTTGGNYMAPFNLAAGAGSGFGAATSILPSINGNWQFEDTGTKVFQVVDGGTKIHLSYYDTATEAADFSDAWTSTIDSPDLGAAFNQAGGWVAGDDLMAYDATTNKLYVVGPGSGLTLEYDITKGTWKQLPTIPTPPFDASFASTTLNSESLEVAGGYLYFMDNNQGGGNYLNCGWTPTGAGNYGAFVRLNLTPEPATMALLAVGAIGMVIRRRRK